MADLEPASALADRILDLPYPTDHAELVELIEADRALVDLVMRNQSDRIASLEAQLASARETAVLECAAALHSKMQLSEAYSLQLSEAYSLQVSLTLWDAKDAVLRLVGKRAPVAGEDQAMLTSERLPPPVAQKEPL